MNIFLFYLPIMISCAIYVILRRRLFFEGLKYVILWIERWRNCVMWNWCHVQWTMTYKVTGCMEW